MMNTLFLRKIALFLLVISFASCDKDFNTIGSDVIGNENFNLTKFEPKIVAYNQKVPAVETNNLPLNQLGIISNSNTVLGTTKYDFITSLTLATLKPTFNKFPVIDSVILTIPYLSTKTGVSGDDSTYSLNGMYTTNTTGTYDPIDLKVYRNGYFLRDTDPVNSGIQKHFSNESAIFNAAKIGNILNDRTVYTAGVKNENTAFIPDEREFKEYNVDAANITLTTVKSRSTPRMRLQLNKTQFQTDIIDRASNPITASDFETQGAFKNYYKGLYFKVDQIAANKGTSMTLNFADGNITIYYKENKENVITPGLPASDKERKTLTLGMNANTVSLFTNTDSPAFTLAVPNPTASIRTPEKKLYLKGGEGAITYLELFTDEQIATLKKDPILINEASLTFTVDNTLITSDYKKAQRIYIFNADDNTPVFDYYFDTSTNSTDALLNKYIHGGLLELVTGGKDTYKVRITEHVNNIIKKGAKNVRLGVIVTENIAVITSRDLITETPAPSTTDVGKTISKIPVASITNRLGTVLYGTNTGTPENDIKFEIYYTKPN
jgi:Domain of unknown function (DUF4270)